MATFRSTTVIDNTGRRNYREKSKGTYHVRSWGAAQLGVLCKGQKLPTLASAGSKLQVL